MENYTGEITYLPKGGVTTATDVVLSAQETEEKQTCVVTVLCKSDAHKIRRNAIALSSDPRNIAEISLTFRIA